LEIAMAVVPSVQEFLRRSETPYTVFPHRPAFTAQEEALVSKTPARDWAKVVICFAGGEPIQAVVPADLHVDLQRLASLAGVPLLRLATEAELDWLFPDCERGAMPPFGPMYRQRVFVDTSLTGEPEIVFNAGTHADAIIMRYADFKRLARPVVGSFAMRVFPA
jgi:Ala-tRNA(Pro) deacylase